MRNVARAACALLGAASPATAASLEATAARSGEGASRAPLASADQGAALREALPWYHSSDEIHENLQQLVANCKGADADLSQRSEFNAAGAAGELVQLDVLHISRSGSNPKARAMLVFGEHARELITGESALHFALTLCGNGPDAQRAGHVLDSFAFTIVPNANPLGRKQVEQGFYCKRTNEDGVDLNRNFGDVHREPGEQPGEEMNPGPRGFSEPESRILKVLFGEEQPEIFISVHSGAYLLGTPFGYTSDRVPEAEAGMLEVLQPISERYCDGECPYGNLAELINYENHGCDIDYVSEHGTPYAFTWEIYVGHPYRQHYKDEARMQREGRRGEGMTGSTNGFSLVQRRLRGRQGRREKTPEMQELPGSCLEQFLPQSEEETAAVAKRWTGAYLALCEEVAAKSAAAAASPSIGAASAANAREVSLSSWFLDSTTPAARAVLPVATLPAAAPPPASSPQ